MIFYFVCTITDLLSNVNNVMCSCNFIIVGS